LKSFDDSFLSIGHRGASGYAPENTLAAFQRAMELGADAVELDVQLTRDEQVVVIHDYRVDRTTDGRGAVRRLLLDELKRLDAGSWFSQKFQGEKIPTLHEVLAFAKGKMLLNIELKKTPEPEMLVLAVRSLLQEFSMTRDCLVTSFDKKAVEEVMKQMPDVRCGLLFEKFSREYLAGGWSFLAPRSEAVDKRLCDAAEKAKKQLLTWTVNDVDEMQRLVNLGVGRIITNYPDQAKKVFIATKKS